MFKKKRQSFLKPVERGFYAFNSQRAGDFLIFYKENKEHYDFFYIPGASLFSLTFEDFNNGLKNNTLSFVEILPKEIFDETLNFVLSNTNKPEYSSIDEKSIS